jgi:hypothetical protein
VPVAARVSGVPGAGALWDGKVVLLPSRLKITGPAQVLAELDSLRLPEVRLDGRRDTVRALLAPEGLPDWCTTDPTMVRVLVPLHRRTP